MRHSNAYTGINDTASGGFFSRVWQLTSAYWRSEDKRMAWLLLVVVVALSLLGVGFAVAFNNWYREFYNALQNKDLAAFNHLILYFCGLAAVAILIAVYRLYLTQMLTIRWRRWLTEQHFAAWLRDKNYYQLEHGGNTDNPDQRMSEDLNSFTESTLGLGLGLIKNVVSLVSFSVILWGVSGSIELFGVEIPGYMFWSSLLYAMLGSWLVHRVARRLIGLNNRQQRFEADLRFSLVRVRENAESIALYEGEANEQSRLMSRFQQVWSNFWQLMRVQKSLTFFSAGYSQVATIFPFIVAAPRYFAGQIQLGDLMQISSAFGQVQDSMSWFIDSYASLANWRATTDRLLSFRQALVEGQARQAAPAISRLPAAADLELQDLSLCLADGRSLLAATNLHIAAGERVLISGASGCGKSTLLRALSGLWPYGSGALSLPAQSLFVPQKPYLPIGSLRAALNYPHAADSHSPERLAKVLLDCRLPHLVALLDQEQHWQQLLSPGEQQRLAIARVLLAAPRWLFLDEATSAMDEADEAALYQLLIEQLPHAGIVSVGHRASLKRFHSRQVRIEQQQLHSSELLQPA
jgi:vitamin B12/bleomycin/antimicrobial peptide transport system ATP-binding/permease protein